MTERETTTERETAAIAALERAERAERERDRLRQMADALPAMITLLRGPELRFEFVSPQAAAEIGQPAEQIVGRSADEVLAGQEPSLAAFRRTLAGGLPVRRAEVPITRDFGNGQVETRIYTTALLPLRDPRGEADALLIYSHDVSEHVRARDAAHEANEKLRVVLEGVADGITMQDPSGAFVYANEAAARASGFATAAELLATPPEDIARRFVLLDEQGSPARAESLPSRRALRGERVEGELVRSRRAGESDERWSVVSSTPVRDAAGDVRFVVNIFRDVTEQRRAEYALRESERRFRAVFETAMDAILLSNDAHLVVDANPAACVLLGRPRDAVIGLSTDELFIPAERADVDQRWARFRAAGRERGEFALLRGDGALRHVEYTATANFVPGRHLAVLRDVTERRAAQTSLQFLAEASATLSASLDYQHTLATVVRLCVPTIADWAAVDMLGPDGTSLARLAVAHVDPARVDLAHELYRRWPPSMDDPHGVPHVLRTAQPEVFWEIPDALLEAVVTDRELLEITRALGLTSSMVVPLMVRGRAVGAISLVTSAESGRRFSESDLVLAQELARRASVAIENATSYREAQEASRLKDEFLATVSHELRTPLTAVLGWAAMVRARQGDAAYVARGLETIERNARAQVQLIEDLLDISRVITGKLRLDIRPVDVGGVVKTALDTIRPAAAAKSIALVPVLDPNAEPVMGDADRVLQVVNNLLTNAVKFTPKGGAVRVYLRRVESSVELVVQDNGEGIDPSFLPHVFERFRQADAGPTRARGGLGLGLAIARSLVEMHGGTVHAESEGAGRGATFTVRLPVAPLRARAESPGPASPARALPDAALAPAAARLDGLRALVVDDDADARGLIETVLTHAGAEVRVAASVAAALELYERERFDVLVSDIGMPGEDGHSLIRKVRALPAERGGRVPAVALTAYASPADRTRALMAGYNVHVAKPVEPTELVVTVANLLGRFSAPPA